jgi:hypothetical protein
MRIRKTKWPIPDISAKLTLHDFVDVLRVVPENCVLVGGQAVAWWAERYRLQPVIEGKRQPITSRDIDFWGNYEDLFSIAKALNTPPALPNRYEMTILVGAIAIKAAETNTALEIIHTVPGLDTTNPLTAAVCEVVQTPHPHKLLILSPISLVLAKIHALRHFSQEGRQDYSHLCVCLEASRIFIAELLSQNVRFALWNCQRLIDIHGQKPFQKQEQTFGFKILSAIPIEEIEGAVQHSGVKAMDRKKLSNFLNIQWQKILINIRKSSGG